MEKFLGNMSDTTEQQIQGLKDMKSIINYDKIINKEFAVKRDKEIQTEDAKTNRQERLYQAQRDLTALGNHELIPFAKHTYGHELVNVWNAKNIFMSEDFFFEQFLNIQQLKVNSDKNKQAMRFSDFFIKKHL